MVKPFSQACENNKRPIFARLSKLIDAQSAVLEIGSGTGQHAIFFAQQSPQLHWQTSDRSDNIEGIKLWLEETKLSNLPQPLTLDIEQFTPLSRRYDCVYSANTLHIMSWETVTLFFDHLKSLLEPGGLFITYGPFKYFGQQTSQSNQDFEQWLQLQEPHRAIRDITELLTLATKNGLTLESDWAMPANNRLLAFRLSN